MKRIISLLIVISLIACIPISVYSIEYGEYSETYRWHLDTETKVLTISGSGVMEDYTSGGCPDYAGCINGVYTGPVAKYVYFNEGITHISNYALTSGISGGYSHPKPYSCYNVIEVYLASTVTSVGNNAFNSGLQKLYVYSESVTFGQNSVPSDAVIYGYKGTNIERFAYENGNEFVALCREHTPELKGVTEAGCITDGYSGDYICTQCGMVTRKGSVILAYGHDYKLAGEAAPDCVNSGYSGDIQCQRCFDVQEYGEVIPATGHSYSDWSVVSNPSCTEEGVKIRFCSVCQEQEKGIIHPLGHTSKEILFNDATCTNNGNISYWSCVVCNKYFSDAELSKEIDIADTVISAKGHEISDWIITNKATYTSEGEKIKKCLSCGVETEREVLPILTNPFTDVSDNAWYTKSVLYCFEKSYINGMSAGRFAPNENITREQFVMILANISGIDTDVYKNENSTMKDVPAGKWYSGAVAWSVKEGYVSGVAEGVFGLGQPIQRAALARLLYLYAQRNGYDVSGRSNLSVYDDFNKVEDWMSEGLSWAVANQIITSASTKTLVLNPRHTATRAQCARMLMVFDTVK